MDWLAPLTALLAYFFISYRADSTVLEVKGVGRLRGTTLRSAFSNRTILAFRGIPYGKAPIGPLRFRDPEPYGPWTGELDASSYGSCCVQPGKRGKQSEDCLFLNVFVRPGWTSKRPVMAYIHGGGWTTGCSSSVRPEYFLDGQDDDVLLVTINYRLGVFGFLTTEDGTAPGNYGLMDQNLALRWIRDHIAEFGGDPEAVTLFGESAGAYAVHHHVLSPLSAGLFQRAILMSGTSLCPRALIEGIPATLLRHGRHLNYTGTADDPKVLVDYLASRTANKLTETQTKLPTFFRTPISYGPVVDGRFLPDHPLNLMRTQQQEGRIPMMIGMTQDEGAFLAGALLKNQSTGLNQLAGNYRQLLPDLLEFHDAGVTEDPAALAEKIWKEYLGKDVDTRNVSHMIGDGLYYHGIIRVIHHLRLKEPPFVYYLSRKPSVHSVLLTHGQFEGMDELGVAHTDDLIYLFPDSRQDLFHPESEDAAMTRRMVRLFTSFAYGRKPPGRDSFLDLNSSPEWKTGPLPFENRMPFWDGLVP